MSEISNFNIVSLFDKSADNCPDKIALIDKDDTEYSFEKLRQLAFLQASVFSSKGILRGDRILVFIPMRIELYITVLALFYIGVTPVFLDEWVSIERLDVCCRLAKCKGFIAPLKLRIMAVASKELRRIKFWFGMPSLKFKNVMHLESYSTSENDTALITFTTGSTGVPKAANRTHGFLKAQFAALQPLLETDQQNKNSADMPMLPIVLLLNLGNGTTSVIADFKPSKPLKFDSGKILDQIIKHKVVSITTSPYYAARLAENLKAEFSGLRKMLIGGGPVFPDLAETICNKFSGLDLLVVYGSTEAEPISHTSGKDLIDFHVVISADKGLLVGFPDTSANVKLISFDYKTGNEFIPYTDINQPGEICVSGNHVLEKYIDNAVAEKQNKIWHEGVCWHRTGDAGYFDSDGRLILLGRCVEIIHLNGQVYYPFLAEYIFQKLPGILRGTLVLKEQRLLVVLQSESDLDNNEALKLVAEKFPLTSVIFHKQIPMDQRHHSKIDYVKLREELKSRIN
ncbi:MAG: AMP-binding protein [Bacteroidia bacterium]|nr:AMP-binding protein [Bacteroidia bacterium]